MKTMRESANGKSSATFTNGAGSPSPSLCSKHNPAKLRAVARAVFHDLMNDLTPFETASPKLQAKCLSAANVALDAAEQFENHYP